MPNSFFRSPSKLFAGSLFIALSLGMTSALSNRSSQSINRSEISTASVFSNPAARRSQNVEISTNNSRLNTRLGEAEPVPFPAIKSPQILPDTRSLSDAEVYFTPEKQFRSISSAPASEPERVTLTIHLCNGIPGNAYFRTQNQQIVGIISQDTVVQLTGKKSGEWIEAIALYWPTNRAIQETGQFWINRCWL